MDIPGKQVYGSKFDRHLPGRFPMENRLSDSFVASSLDAGHQNLAWEPGPPSGFLAGIDIKAILADPHAEEIVPELPAQALYYAIKQVGIEESLDLLPMLTPEQ